MTAPLPPGHTRPARAYIDRSADDDTAMRARFAPFGDWANLPAPVTGQRWERFWTRLVSGLSLLMMLALPLSLVPAIWTGDLRWFLSGIVLGLVGFGIGVVITQAAKKVRR